MFNLYVFGHSTNDIITREVLTLTDIAAVAGGFANIIVLATQILAKIYSSIMFKIDLI
jgi:hypothetical protein